MNVKLLQVNLLILFEENGRELGIDISLQMIWRKRARIRYGYIATDDLKKTGENQVWIYRLRWFKENGSELGMDISLQMIWRKRERIKYGYIASHDLKKTGEN